MMNADMTRWVEQTRLYVRQAMANAEPGHDWWHAERVCRLAMTLARSEAVDALVVQLAALLHDIADHKFHGGDETLGPRRASQFLVSLGVPDAVVSHVAAIVANISFKGGHATQTFRSPELDVVQDADRLDAMGAIGIARTFSFGGFARRELYNPDVPPALNQSPEQYKANRSHTINHFYEKLLLLKDRMNTPTAQRMAEQRHRFMEDFLEAFYREWEGV